MSFLMFDKDLSVTLDLRYFIKISLRVETGTCRLVADIYQVSEVGHESLGYADCGNTQSLV